MDWAAWQADRLAALRAEDGWLNLTDRVEIAPGRMTVGRAAQKDVVLSVGPDVLGVLELCSDLTARLTTGIETLDFHPQPEAPARLSVAGLLLEIHVVDGAAALRVRLIDDPRRQSFGGITCFPFDPAWVVRAEWVALPSPITRQAELVKGRSDRVTQTHVARFSHAGHDVGLVPLHMKAGRPMFVIRDATSGCETYAASRFLIGEVVGNMVVLDFNRAFNPPCAFTDFAVCPLPPPENRLPFAIRAGERAPDPH